MTYWSQLIKDLQDKGKMTQKEIAEVALCSQNYISDLKTGKRGENVSYKIAKNLEQLHKQKINAA